MSDPIAPVGKAAGRTMTAFGVLTVVLGLAAMMAPFVAGMSIRVMVGLLLVGAGMARVLWALGADNLGQGLLKFAPGGLTLVCGVLMLARPLFALGSLTLFLAAYFVVDGVVEIMASLRVKPANGWGWLLFGGLVSLLLGIMMWRQFPVSGTWAIGILVGVKLLFAGLSILAVGSVVRSAGAAAAN